MAPLTRKRLHATVLLVMGSFALAVVAAVVCRFVAASERWYSLIRDFSPLLIATGGAYLAYCFQQRQAFLVSLRDLWRELVEAKAELVAYTHDPAPDQAAFLQAHKALSKAIDAVRIVYRNVGETERSVGLYPFEPLHDMRKLLDGYGHGEVTPEQQLVAREQVTRSWNALRWAFLKEFAAPEPPDPITRRGMGDPRRRGTDGSRPAPLPCRRATRGLDTRPHDPSRASRAQPP